MYPETVAFGITRPAAVRRSWRMASQAASPLAGAEHTGTLRCATPTSEGAAEAVGANAAVAKTRTVGTAKKSVRRVIPVFSQSMRGYSGSPYLLGDNHRLPRMATCHEACHSKIPSPTTRIGLRVSPDRRTPMGTPAFASPVTARDRLMAIWSASPPPDYRPCSNGHHPVYAAIPNSEPPEPARRRTTAASWTTASDATRAPLPITTSDPTRAPV